MMREPERLRGWAGKLLLASVAIVVTLAGLEIALRLLGLADPPTYDLNPNYGYLMRPNQVASTRGYHFRINQAGLRGRDFAIPKPSGLFRIAFLGDSITYGGGAIRDEDLFVNRVGSELSKSGRPVEAINIAAPGWGFENMAGYIEEVGLHDSDLVVWVVPSADFRRPKMTAAENNFRESKPVSRLFYALWVSWKKLSKRLEATGSPRGGVRQNAGVLERNLEVFDHVLAQTTMTRKVVVVFLPSANGYDSSQELEQFQSVAASRGVAFLDLAPLFRQRNSKEAFLDGVHLSESGHELVGKSIVNFLKENLSSSEETIH